MISFVSSSQLETFHRHHHYLSSFSFFSCVSWSSSPVVHRTNHIMHTTIVILLTFSFYPYVFLFFSLSLLSSSSSSPSCVHSPAPATRVVYRPPLRPPGMPLRKLLALHTSRAMFPLRFPPPIPPTFEGQSIPLECHHILIHHLIFNLLLCLLRPLIILLVG